MTAQGSTLREYLGVLRRRKWIALQAIVIVPVASVALSMLQPAEYSASAEVLLSRQNLAGSLSNVVDPTFSVDPQRLVETQTSVARSPQVAATVVQGTNPRLTAGEFLGMSSVGSKTGQDVLVFRVSDRRPAVAVRLANRYAESYIAYATMVATRAIRNARSEVQEKIASLEARGETKSAFYDDLAGKEQQLATMEALQTGNATLLTRANGASQIAPTPVRNGVLGLLVGVVLGLGLAFLRDHLDTRVRNADEVSERLGLPLLGRLPEPSKKLRKRNRLVMLEEPDGEYAEQFRVLVANLEFVARELEPRTLMVTSAREAEGKSTTAANLAVALARTGKRIALVDLDLRRPFLHSFFRISPEPGLTTMAIGGVTLDEALVPVSLNGKPSYRIRGNPPGEPTLDLLCSGAIPTNPGELIRSRGISRLISHLRETHDMVIIDAAPLLGLGDSLVLIPQVDAVLLVTMLDVVRRSMLGELSRVIESTGANVLGIVATAAERDDEAYGYGYGYYGYRYGGPKDGRSLPAAEQPRHEERL